MFQYITNYKTIQSYNYVWLTDWIKGNLNYFFNFSSLLINYVLNIFYVWSLGIRTYRHERLINKLPGGCQSVRECCRDVWAWPLPPSISFQPVCSSPAFIVYFFRHLEHWNIPEPKKKFTILEQWFHSQLQMFYIVTIELVN